MELDTNEILSAFIDGEHVDVATLAEALAAPGAREALLDFLRLRALMESAEEPSATFVRRMRSRLRQRSSPGALRALRWAAAAAVLALAIVGTVDLGQRLWPPQGDAPPQASRVVHFQPGVDWNEVTED